MAEVDMRYIKNRQAKFVVAVVGVIVMAIVASWQFSLFVMFGNSQGHFPDIQGGRYHLWLAASAALMACIASGLMFFIFSYDDKGNDIRVEPPRAPAGDHLIAKSPASASFDAVYWDQLNEWHLEGQSDDRRPMLGSVGASAGSSSAQRSTARLSHQVRRKQWSKERHD
jgi:hypothetical protein